MSRAHRLIDVHGGPFDGGQLADRGNGRATYQHPDWMGGSGATHVYKLRARNVRNRWRLVWIYDGAEVPEGGKATC